MYVMLLVIFATNSQLKIIFLLILSINLGEIQLLNTSSHWNKMLILKVDIEMDE